jgi:hypothetical protein
MSRKHNYPPFRASSKPARRLVRQVKALVADVHRKNLAAGILGARRALDEADTSLAAARKRLDDLGETLRMLGLGSR